MPAAPNDKVAPYVRPIGLYLIYAGNIERINNVISLSVDRQASERSKLEATLAYEDLESYLRDVHRFTALATAGAGRWMPILPLQAEGASRHERLTDDKTLLPLGASWGEFATYSVESDVPMTISISAVGPEVYTDLWNGKGRNWPAGSKVRDILKDLAEDTSDGKPAWKIRFIGVSEKYAIGQAYDMAGRSPTESFIDLCRSFGLVYSFEMHRSTTLVTVYGPAGLELPWMRYWEAVEPPAWVSIVNGFDRRAIAKLGGVGWQKVINNETGLRNPDDILGQAEKMPDLVDGLPFLAKVSANFRILKDTSWKELIARTIKAIADADRTLADEWKELANKTLEQATRANGGVLELVPIAPPKFHFEPPPRDTMRQAAEDVGGSGQMAYDYGPPKSVQEAARQRYSTEGSEIIGKEGDKYFIVNLDGQKQYLSPEDKVHLVKDRATGKAVGFLVAGSVGNGDLTQYYPYQVSITVPGVGFLHPFQAVEMRGWGIFLNGWWRILAVRTEWSGESWIASLTLGRKDFPFLTSSPG